MFLMGSHEMSDAFFANNPNSPFIENSIYKNMSEIK